MLFPTRFDARLRSLIHTEFRLTTRNRFVLFLCGWFVFFSLFASDEGNCDRTISDKQQTNVSRTHCEHIFGRCEQQRARQNIACPVLKFSILAVNVRCCRCSLLMTHDAVIASARESVTRSAAPCADPLAKARSVSKRWMRFHFGMERKSAVWNTELLSEKCERSVSISNMEICRDSVVGYLFYNLKFFDSIIVPDTGQASNTPVLR